MSFVLLGILNSQASGVAQTYFLNRFGTTAEDDFGLSAAADSEGNLYQTGRSETPGFGSNDWLSSKFASDGTLEWQKGLGGTGYDQADSITVDTSNNVFVTGIADNSLTSSQQATLAKYNSSGSLQWQRALSSGSNDSCSGIATDSAGNAYIVGRTLAAGSGGNEILIAKYNSSGSLQWQRLLGDSDSDIGKGIATDSNDNVYVVAESGDLSVSRGILLAKYNSSGTIQWQRILESSGDFHEARGISVDSTDNIYVVGREKAGTRQTYLAKYNSSGTLQWQRRLGGTSGEAARGVANDSSNNVYILFLVSSEGAGSVDFGIAKYNSSGTLQWQRFLGGNDTDAPAGIVLDSFDNIFVNGDSDLNLASGKNYYLSAKLPNDGSLLGTYTLDGYSITYQAGNFTSETADLNSNVSSRTTTTPSFSSSTTTLTDSATSATSITLDITD